MLGQPARELRMSAGLECSGRDRWPVWPMPTSNDRACKRGQGGEFHRRDPRMGYHGGGDAEPWVVRRTCGPKGGS